MGLFENKVGVIMGVANDRSIASGIAKFIHQEGGKIAYSHLPDESGRMEKRIRRVVDDLDPKLVAPCDVNKDSDIASFFLKVEEVFGKIDFFVHSVAFAPKEDIRCSTVDVSREGFRVALDSSCYSFIATARAAAKIMNDNGAILTMSYFGGEKVCAGYNLMGVAKAALECSVRYLAYDLGPRGIRVNSVSAGPIKTLAASAVGDFSQMLGLNAGIAPMGRTVTIEEVGRTSGFLLSDYSSGTTGENVHVDCGYNIMGNLGRAFERWNVEPTVTKGALD
ncbi:MAG: enoyl-ACP reductase [Bdellovibrionota bacterium]